MTTTTSDLSWDLVGEILSRVPFTSLSVVRSTCKTWNDLTKSQILGEKAARKQFLAFVMIYNDYSIARSLRFELQGIRNGDYDYDEDLADSPMKKLSIPNHQVEIDQVFHCDGLLLCVGEDPSKLLVWNPYLAQTRLIQTSSKFHSTSHRYALGYDNNNNNRNHKILRFYMYSDKIKGIELYDFSSDSWRVLDVSPMCYMWDTSVSLKGNTYFCGKTEETEETEGYLLCFDFTRERFGPRLPLPSNPYDLPCENVTLSRVSDEKFALLYDHYAGRSKVNIWTTAKIEPNAVLWNKFLTLDMDAHHGLPYVYMVGFDGQSFFIDEEKKVAVFFYAGPGTFGFLMAYIIGEDGYFRSVNMGEAPLKDCTLKCSSYVPSLVKLQV